MSSDVLRLIDRPELLRARLKAAPDSPGVYVMRDAHARVAYVGKAASLRNRLRSYFTGLDTLAPHTRHLVNRVFDFEVITCANEREALILENTLIKQHRPRFNIRLKDDKNYLYLKIPRPGADDTFAPGTAREVPRQSKRKAAGQAALFPRPYYTRRIAADGARYFGPFTNAQALRSTVKALRTIFPFRTCSDEIFRRGRVCLDYHIKRCCGPCEAKVTAAEYAQLLDEVELFMHGDQSTVASHFEERMTQASDELDFELAARYRDRLGQMERIAQRQRMIGGTRADEDVVAVATAGDDGTVAVLTVRQGRVMGMETHPLEGVSGLSAAECLTGFVTQYYDTLPAIPRIILTAEDLPNSGPLKEFLEQRRGGTVELRAPQRGRGRDLVGQARTTAEAALQQRRISEDFDAAKTAALLEDLARQLDLEAPPQRIECYDISNTMGTNSVGSMVVFEDGRPNPAHYRHFGIKTVSGPDDFRSMEETLRRRFARLLRERNDGDIPVSDPDGSNGTDRRAAGGGDVERDASFGVVPDLILIDGGKGQLGVAHSVLVEAGLDSIPVFGLAKRNEELFRPGRAESLVLPRDSATLFLIQRVRDEAHRFAITRHRSKRGKTALKSRLDIIPGLGPARKRALLRQFGSVEGIKQATLEELAALPEVPMSLALRLKELL